MAVTVLRVDTPFPSILLGWSHWATAQGSLRELAARWTWDRSCRATLGLWRQRLEQWQEAEQWPRERGRRLVRDALRHWHSCWQSESGTGRGNRVERGPGSIRDAQHSAL